MRKVFPELYELQQHFKLDHKNVILAPSTVIPHRAILPKPSEIPESTRSQHFTTFPPGAAVPFVIREQPLPHSSSRSNDPQYRGMSHNMQGVFYPPPSNNRSTYSRQPRVVYSSSNQGPHHNRDRDHYSTSRQYDQKYPSSSMMRKESPYNDKGSHNRKRDYPEYHHHRDRYTPEPADSYTSKRNKLEYEASEKPPSSHLKSENSKNQINLSEYTNNAMNSQQYFSKRFVQKDGVGHHDTDPPNQVHQCKICGNEFPRYEYLLTHLRKHKQLEHDEDNLNGTDTEKLDVDMSNDSGSPDNRNHGNINRRNYESSKTNFVESHEGIPIVHQQPPQPPSHRNNEGIKIPHPPVPPPGIEPIPVYAIPIQPPAALQTGVVSENTMDAITPGVDGKFRPFICENCGQRFTRKDSLVRHAKKQTCYEEQVDLKCKHCDKTFRYHKCLIQHQELVHGISREEQAKSKPVKNSDDEDTDSDRSDKNESFQEQENQQPSTPSSIETPKPPTKYRSPHTTMSEVKTFKQSSTTFYPNTPPSQQQQQQQQPPPPPPIAVGFAPTNPYTKIEIPANPYKQIEGPGNEAPKFIPPRIDDKASKIGELSNGSSSTSGNQDTQYIGYCTVARPFQCEYCGDRFAHRHSLKRHIRRHLGIGIPCVECGKLYRDQSEWRRHQKSIHNRHYEKYEVPSRISYRDGMENGMIGMVPSNEFASDNNDGSDSEKSGDEEITMVKPSNNFQHNSSFGNHSSMAEEIQKAQSEISQHLKEANYERANRIDDKDDSGEENKQSKQPFNFKSFSSGDKDSRKSALDRYLQSTHSDEEDDHRETTVFVEPKNEFVETNNNNNSIEEKNKFGFHQNENMADMVTVGMSNN
ncbi:uncharacterized protein [Clytia hemisphaerica]|uniref:C2H2-type domain-containing protein n=1 Tax=Clytia hemisphaerica TaxID=252671 RepID=A0A7M5UXQ7_9CNID